MSGNKKQSKTLRKRKGEDWFSVIAGKPHKRGNAFSNPEVRQRALNTRVKNKMSKIIEDELKNEIQTDDSN